MLRDEVGELGAALSVRGEDAGAGEHGGVRLGEGQAEIFGEFGGQRLAVPLLELGLGVEEIESGWGRPP